MDFERASIKALFYDYPVEAVVKAIEDGRKNKDDYINILPQLVRWREDAFTTTEARMMENLAQDFWMNLDNGNALDDYIDEPNLSRIPFIYRPFLLVKYLANKMVVQDAKTLHPVVVFNQILRWKDITLFLGEDLLTTAYMADNDLMTKRQTTIFNWPDLVSHNNVELNEILNHGLTDLHAHYFATCEVFSFNWIDLTNSLNFIERKTANVKSYQDVTLSTAGTEQLYSFQRICIAATFLRLQFFKLLNGLYEKDEYLWQQITSVKKILEDDFYAKFISRHVNEEISVWRTYALRSRNGRTLDYAILPNDEIRKHIKDANLIFHGERKLLYQFFYRFFAYDKQIWALAPYFYLYIVLKTRIRKEFIQINQLKGFENFETYQDRKDIFIENNSPIADVIDPLILHTTLRNSQKDFLEGRIKPKDLSRMAKTSRLCLRNYNRGVFTNCQVLDNPSEHISFVIHFIKANYSRKEKEHDLYLNNRQDFARYANYRRQLKEEIDIVLSQYDKQKTRPSNIKVVGVDAASTEMFCRPEVFGHVFRYARRKGLINQTYHVGEDFFDIVDGLRAIDEALLFLGLDSHCRIGHGLAMGIDAEQYYNCRRFRIIAPRQYVLDNCVWLCMKCSKEDVEIPNSLETELNRLARELYKTIGYNKSRIPFDMQTYWNSMLLRGDEPIKQEETPEQSLWAKVSLTEWQRTAEVEDEIVKLARNDQDARRLFQLYHFNRSIKEEGEKRYAGKYPATIITVVNKLQEKMRRRVCSKQIAVETNPSSNLKIGYIENCYNHPLLTCFDPIEEQVNANYPLLKACVNTDDRGVFATTLYNEFSFLALGMMKLKDEKGQAKYGTRQIIKYINRVRQSGETLRYKVQ